MLLRAPRLSFRAASTAAALNAIEPELDFNSAFSYSGPLIVATIDAESPCLSIRAFLL